MMKKQPKITKRMTAEEQIKMYIAQGMPDVADKIRRAISLWGSDPYYVARGEIK